MSNFLNAVQVKELQKKKWSVTPSGAFVTLYREDFQLYDMWRQVCEQLNVDPNTDEVTILYFGTKN